MNAEVDSRWGSPHAPHSDIIPNSSPMVHSIDEIHAFHSKQQHQQQQHQTNQKSHEADVIPHSYSSLSSDSTLSSNDDSSISSADTSLVSDHNLMSFVNRNHSYDLSETGGNRVMQESRVYGAPFMNDEYGPQHHRGDDGMNECFRSRNEGDQQQQEQKASPMLFDEDVVNGGYDRNDSHQQEQHRGYEEERQQQRMADEYNQLYESNQQQNNDNQYSEGLLNETNEYRDDTANYEDDYRRYHAQETHTLSEEVDIIAGASPSEAGRPGEFAGIMPEQAAARQRDYYRKRRRQRIQLSLGLIVISCALSYVIYWASNGGQAFGMNNNASGGSNGDASVTSIQGTGVLPNATDAESDAPTSSVISSFTASPTSQTSTVSKSSSLRPVQSVTSTSAPTASATTASPTSYSPTTALPTISSSFLLPTPKPTRRQFIKKPSNKNPASKTPTSKTLTSNTPTSNTPTNQPAPEGDSESPTAEASRLEDLRKILLPISGFRALSNPTSPQSITMKWLADVDKMEISVEPVNLRNIVQRYVTALLFFSMGGRNWNHQLMFLSRTNECLWSSYNPTSDSYGGINCNLKGDVTKIELEYNNLNGEIPSEISHLRSLVFLELDNNQITGTIPDSMSKLTNLESIYLNSNLLTGSLDEAFCDQSGDSNGEGATVPSSIQIFWADCMEKVECSCCDICCGYAGCKMMTNL